MRLTLFLALLFFGPIASAEDPVLLGFKKAAANFAAVPEATANQAIATADAHLATYIKTYGENHCAAPLGGTRKWVELQGLAITDVRFDAISDADRANGIEERLHVTVDVNRYRQLEANDTWSIWHNGRPLGIPNAVTVEKKQGRWSGTSFIGSLFKPVGDGRLNLPVKPSLVANLTPSVAPAPTKPRPAPPVRQASAKPTPSATPRPVGAEQITAAFIKPLIFVLLPCLVAIAGIAAAIGFARNRRRRPMESAFASRSRIPGSTPPPLPTSAGPDPCRYSARSHLHTETERTFLQRLGALIAPSCSINGNVRLADLFDAPAGRDFQSAFNRISSKHVDFVITDRATTRILCAIELDDHSHQRPDRIERDHFLNRLFHHSPIPLLRIPIRDMRDTPHLKQALRSAFVPLSETAYMPREESAVA